jgi:thymidylate synthase (FAD)
MFQTDFDRALAAYHDWLHKLKLAMPDGLAPTIKKKRAQEAARCFLPNAAETRLVWTMNMRSARNVIEQRGNEHADLEIRRLAVGFTHELKRVAPATFFDADIYTADDGFEAVRVKHSKV